MTHRPPLARALAADRPDTPAPTTTTDLPVHAAAPRRAGGELSELLCPGAAAAARHMLRTRAEAAARVMLWRMGGIAECVCG